MESKKTYYTYLFFQLLKADLNGFRSIAVGRIIDTVIWVASMVWVTVYILPALGVTTQFGLLTLSGLVASAGIMAVYPNVVAMVVDLTGDMVISYQLTLPLPSWLVLVKNMIYYAIMAATYSFLALPVGKLFMWNQFSLTTISPVKFSIIFILSSLFCGAFSLFLASLLSKISKLGHVWMRVVYPLWFFGGFQFSWLAFHRVAPAMSYGNLLNPFVYVFEGTRAALLGQVGYLNFWACCGGLVISIFVCGSVAILLLRRRLDFV